MVYLKLSRQWFTDIQIRVYFTNRQCFVYPINMDLALRQDRKTSILNRLNHKVRVRNLTKQQSPDPLFKPPQDSREEYIEKLKARIKELEMNSRIESSRFDGTANTRKHYETVRKPESPPIASKGAYDINTALAKDNSGAEKDRSQSSSAYNSSSSLSRSTNFGSNSNNIRSSAKLTKLPQIFKLNNSQAIPEKDPSMRLVKCTNCDRSFRAERIDTHRNV